MRKPFNNDYPLTQGWGGNSDTYIRFGLKGHNGLDYGVPTGTEIVAPHDGKVLEVTSDLTGYGNYLKIESPIEGSLLAHLQEVHVAVGDLVKEGQVVAKSDNTGFSTAPHLHWGYYRIPRNREDGYLGYINQLPLIEEKTDEDYFELDGFKLNLADRESMKEVMKVWVRLQKGELVDIEKLNTQTDTLQKLADGFKIKADENLKLYEDEKRKNLDLHKANAEIAKEDLNDAEKAYDAEHLASDRAKYLHMISDQLQTNYDPTDDKKTVEEILMEITELQKTRVEAPQGIPQPSIPPMQSIKKGESFLLTLPRFLIGLFLLRDTTREPQAKGGS